MDDYVISDTEEEEPPLLPFPPTIIQSAKHFELHKNTKLQPMVQAAVKELKEGHTCLIRGIDQSAEKAISVVEMIKRDPELIIFQWNELALLGRVQYWNPIEEGLSRLRVRVHTPTMYILVQTSPFEVGSESIQCSLEDTHKVNADRKGGLKKSRGGKGDGKWTRKKAPEKERESNQRREVIDKLDNC